MIATAGAVLLAAGYLAGVRRLARRGVPPSPGRVLATVLGAALVVTGSAPALAGHGAPTPAAVTGHLLATMAGPLLLALGAPLTVALRALPRSPRRRLVRVLRSAPVRLLVRAPAVAVLAVAGTAVAWLVPLPHAWHGVWHAHMVVTGFLLAAVVAGVDPVRRDLSVPARLAGVVATGAGHDLVARLAWARAGSGSGRAGAELLATGGHLVDAALAVVVLAGWYRREGRRQAAVRRRTAA